MFSNSIILIKTTQIQIKIFDDGNRQLYLIYKQYNDVKTFTVSTYTN